MEDFFFGLFLWIVLFSFGCWMISEPSSPATPEMKTESQAPDVEGSAHPFDVQVREMFDKVFDDMATVAEESVTEDGNTFDVDLLTLREARAVIRALNQGLPKNDLQRIRQKVNGKDAPLSWMKEQIRTRLKAEPDREREVLTTLRAA